MRFDHHCDESTGCIFPEREDITEHIAGPGCTSIRGYNGWRISLEEMEGCRAAQALVPKDHVENWKPEDDDQDFELESEFLSGIGDGPPIWAPMDNMNVRHGLREFGVLEDRSVGIFMIELLSMW